MTTSTDPDPASSDAGRQLLAALFDPATRADPYPLYRSRREERGLHRAGEQVCVLTRHADCAAVLRDPRFGHEDEPSEVLSSTWTSDGRPRAAVVEADGTPVRSFLLRNPPDHTRLRRLALRELARRAPSLRLAGEPEWKENIVLRGLSRLPVAAA